MYKITYGTNIPSSLGYVIMFPLPLELGGHLDLLWFSITQMCIRVRPRPSVPDIVYMICPTVFHQ